MKHIKKHVKTQKNQFIQLCLTVKVVVNLCYE
jgi:hypothetical protein